MGETQRAGVGLSDNAGAWKWCEQGGGCGMRHFGKTLYEVVRGREQREKVFQLGLWQEADGISPLANLKSVIEGSLYKCGGQDVGTSQRRGQHPNINDR